MALPLNIIWGDSLGGHLDDMEADWSKPIISLRYYANFFFFSFFLFGILTVNLNTWTRKTELHSWFYVFPPLWFSLGCKAIFLLGGKSRDDPPLAMFLRSGDVVLMGGEARECFHGRCYNYFWFYCMIWCCPPLLI